MNVKQLITELKQCNPEDTVMMGIHPESCGYNEHFPLQDLDKTKFVARKGRIRECYGDHEPNCVILYRGF